MQSIDLIRENLRRSAERTLLRIEETFDTRRLCFQYVADHWYMHRGQLADCRRAAGVGRMWL